MMNHFQRSERIILHNADRESDQQLLYISMTRSAEDCTGVLLDVHVAGIYFPRQPSRIIKCTPNKLVIKGMMIIFGSWENFKLTFRLNKKVKKNPTIWWDASLDLSAGKNHPKFFMLHENNYEPDQIISPVTYRDERIQKGAFILLDSLHHTYCFEVVTFAGWHPQSKYFVSIRRASNRPREYAPIHTCFAIFTAPTPSTPHPNAITIPTAQSCDGDMFGEDSDS